MLRFIYLDGMAYWLVIHFEIQRPGRVIPTGATLFDLEYREMWIKTFADLPTSLRMLVTDECNRASRQISSLGHTYAFKLPDPDE